MTECKHHWKIDAPDGIERRETVGARCRLCGSERDFALGYNETPRRPQTSHGVRTPWAMPLPDGTLA